MFLNKNDSTLLNGTTYISASNFEKIERRMKRQRVWGTVLVIFFGPGIVGGIMNYSEDLKASIPMYIFFATFGVLLLLFGYRKKKLLGSARRFNSIFMADNDGTITCEEMTVQLGIPSYKIFNQLDKLFRLGMFQYCTLQSAGNPRVIINNAMATMTNIGFVQVQCANCGGVSKIRAGSRGRCEYCNTELTDQK